MSKIIKFFKHLIIFFRIDRFKNAGFKTKHISFVKIGRPNLFNVFTRSVVKWNKRVDGYKVLYLPTWEGVVNANDYS
ncbi:MAG: hypothetical protein LBG21_07695 [Campylobacteraceae bacterium]|nr:hypothetical protein [Campylobacteraceae bacterium]